MAQSPDQMAATMVANMSEKTGKPLDEWLRIVGQTGLAKHGEVIKFLKSEHGMTHGFANLVAAKHLEAGTPTASDDVVDAQYAGAKAGLRPIYDALIGAISAFGSDIEVSPKKAYVSLRRNKQFALIQPSTKDRVDVGINLKDVATTGRLEKSGSFNSMVSHRVRLASPADVDAELIGWLEAAYESS